MDLFEIFKLWKCILNQMYIWKEIYLWFPKLNVSKLFWSPFIIQSGRTFEELTAEIGKENAGIRLYDDVSYWIVSVITKDKRVHLVLNYLGYILWKKNFFEDMYQNSCLLDMKVIVPFPPGERYLWWHKNILLPGTEEEIRSTRGSWCQEEGGLCSLWSIFSFCYFQYFIS